MVHQTSNGHIQAVMDILSS